MKRPTLYHKLLFVTALFFLCCTCCEGQIVTTLSGNGTPGFTGDGGPAGNAQLNTPIGLCIDVAGNLYIGDYGNQRIRKIDKATGIISTIAGTGATGFSGDGAPALNATFNGPYFMCFDNMRNCLYFSDYWNYRIRSIDMSTGLISTIAGDGSFNYINGGIAKNSGMLPEGLAMDASGNLIFSQHAGPLYTTTTNIISKLDMSTGMVTTIAGNGLPVFAGDGGPALNASFNEPMGLALDASGNIFVADFLSQRIRKINKATGTVTTVAGDGNNNLSPDGQPAVSSSLKNPSDVIMDNSGNLILVDELDQRLRMVDRNTGILTSLAGTGYVGYGQDCVQANTNLLGMPNNAAMDAAGILYFNDQSSHRIRMVIPANAKPTVQISASAATICPGAMVKFTAVVQQGSPTDMYQWTVNGKPTAANSSVYQTDTLNNNDLVECQVSSSLGKLCPSLSTAFSNDIKITVSAPIIPSVNIATSKTNICSGGLVSFTATTQDAGSNIIYQWLLNGNPIGNNSNTLTGNNFSDKDQISCTITADATQSCMVSPNASSNSIIMNVSALPAPSVQIDASAAAICPGDSVLFAAIPKNAGTDISYQWLINGNDIHIDQSSIVARNISDGDQVSCMLMTTNAACGNNEWVSSNRETVSLKTVPQIQFSDSVVVIRPGQQAQLHASVDNGTISYNWQPATDLMSANTLDPMTVSLEENQLFQLSVMAANGCRSEKNLLVEVFFHLAMPNAFTPDGNGKNDLFRIPPKTTMTLNDFSVYDRWGNRVFKTRDIGKGWDGTMNGMPVPAGTYIYIITGHDLNGAILAKGTVLLLR